MKVLVIGAGGIVGQHMIFSKPDDVDAVFTRTVADGTYEEFNYLGEVTGLLDLYDPDIVLNLAGQNNVDEVEKNPNTYYGINVKMPSKFARSCRDRDVKFVQVSTQAVFSGDDPPYTPESPRNPVNAYGVQNVQAEDYVLDEGGHVVRLTFVYGIRPFQSIGRKNPLEVMLESEEEVQVNDHFFSPLLADDAAYILWDLITNKDQAPIVHVGEPIKVSRFDLSCHNCWASFTNKKIHPVSHKYFKGIAERPTDTTWAVGSLFNTKLDDALLECWGQFHNRAGDKLERR